MDRFENKKIVVLGFGVEGKSTVRFLLDAKARIAVFDNKPEQEFEKTSIKFFKEKGVKFHFGPFPKQFLGFDILVRSPGVNPHLPVLKNALRDGIIVTSPTNIFFDLCPCPIIGVTGTKGKGTTSTLIYEMLKAQNRDLPAGRQGVYLGGNIGTPPLDFFKKLTKDSWVVLELSSFQLQDITHSPHIAVVLMITSEHLDYHKNVMEYVDAKRNILKFQTKDDFAIINRDYPASNESDTHTDGQIYQVSIEREVKQGCFVYKGDIVIRKEFAQNQRSKIKDQKFEDNIISIKDILLPGRHNLENMCAAVMAARLAGVSVRNIVKVLKSFKGLEHRLELVATVAGVRYYDDSFSTTPETAIAAIEAFSDPEILILGGSSKGSDFTHLGEVISSSKNIKAIIGVGKEWPRIKESIKYKVLSIKYIEGCKNMSEIVQAAARIAEVGDIVLLSPACASFDMFKDYKDRGEKFEEEVQKLNNNSF